MKKMYRYEGVPVRVLEHLAWYMIFGTVIGAHLGHCLFYEPEYYFRHPVEFLNFGVGLSSHGGATGILIALYIFSRRERRPYLRTLDRIVIVVALAGFFIRMGNLMNSEIYGIETALPWGFIFTRMYETVPKHPTQIYEALSYLVIFLILGRIYVRNKGLIYPGVLFGLFLALLFTVRFLIEFIKEEQVAFEKGMFLNMGQMLSIPFILLGIYFLIRPKIRYSEVREKVQEI
jgi:prolipoprotein diacylglyceryl transferase